MSQTKQKAGIYIHIPFCTAKCIYCDFYSVADRSKEIPDFINTICKEINLFFSTHKYSWEFNTLFLGGGTPSLLNKAYIESILNTLNQHISLNNIEEFTIETNPGEITKQKLKDFISIGANRLSLGFQTFDENLLKFLGRIHSPEDCIETYNNAREAGFNNINTDLIFDIPGQTMNRWKQDLKKIVDLDPEHISTYSLTVEENTKLFKLVNNKKVIMPSEKMDIDMYSYTLKYLKEQGYTQYEISNHSKRNYRCQHNMHYWKNDPYLSFGPSAHSYDMQKRWWNIDNLNLYMEMINNNELPLKNSEQLTSKDHFNELIFNGLRMSDGVNVQSLEKYYDKSIENYINFNTKKWNGLNYKDGVFYLDEDAILLADEIASDLFI
tara:strand:- start:381 stop:1523 length:1143 start_codon:yes stop_codon:yes gene_type:complete